MQIGVADGKCVGLTEKPCDFPGRDLNPCGDGATRLIEGNSGPTASRHRPGTRRSRQTRWPMQLFRMMPRPRAVRRDGGTSRAEFLPKLKRVLAQVPFAADLLAAYYAVLDRQTPMRVRRRSLAALAYFVSADRRHPRHDRRARLYRRRRRPLRRLPHGRRRDRAAAPRGGAALARGSRLGRTAGR